MSGTSGVTTSSPNSNRSQDKGLGEDALFEYVLFCLEHYEGRGIRESIVLTMHNILMKGEYDAGEYRAGLVKISGAIIIPPPARIVPSRMRDLLGQLETSLSAAKDEDDRHAAIVQFFHEFNAIHPFEDGNGRISRALLHLLLRQEHLLETRNDFYDVFAYRRDEYLDFMKQADAGNIDYLSFFIHRGISDAVFKDFAEQEVSQYFLSLASPATQAWVNPAIRGTVDMRSFFGRLSNIWGEIVALANDFDNDAYGAWLVRRKAGQ